MKFAAADFSICFDLRWLTTAVSRHEASSGSRSRESTQSVFKSMPVIFQTAALALAAFFVLLTLISWLHVLQPRRMNLLGKFSTSESILLSRVEFFASPQWHPCRDSRRGSPVLLPGGNRGRSRALDEFRR